MYQTHTESCVYVIAFNYQQPFEELLVSITCEDTTAQNLCHYPQIALKKAIKLGGGAFNPST